MVHSPKMPSQRWISSGLVQASKTSSRGAWKPRVMTSSRSPRGKIESLLSFTTPPSTLVAPWFLACALKLAEKLVEILETALPEASVLFEPALGLGHGLG